MPKTVFIHKKCLENRCLLPGHSKRPCFMKCETFKFCAGTRYEKSCITLNSTKLFFKGKKHFPGSSKSEELPYMDQYYSYNRAVFNKCIKIKQTRFLKLNWHRDLRAPISAVN